MKVYCSVTSGQRRVIGTLLGHINGDFVEITNSFPVPHTEDEQIAVDVPFHRTMLELNKKASPKEVIVGWYATGTEIDYNSAFFNNFYWMESGLDQSPIHLLVDTELKSDSLSTVAYVNRAALTVGDQPIVSQFVPVELEYSGSDPTKVGVRSLPLNPEGGSLTSDFDNLEQSLESVLEMIKTVTTYVTEVLEGKREGDKHIGRYLVRAVHKLPKITSQDLDKLFNDNLQDLLLVVYLANLTKTQLSLAESLLTTV